MRKFGKISQMIVLTLALVMLAACGSSYYAPEEESPTPSTTEAEAPPEAGSEEPSEPESEEPSETEPETPSEPASTLEPVEYTAEDWEKYLGSYVSLTTGEPLDLAESWGLYQLQRPRPGDGRHMDIYPLTPGKDAVYIASDEIIYASLTLRDGNLLIESTGEEPSFDAMAGVYALSGREDTQYQQDEDPLAWREPSSWDKEILTNYLGDYVKENTNIHLQIEHSFGTFLICTPRPGYPHTIEVFNPRLVAGTVSENGDGSFSAGDRNGDMILILTMENGVLSVENTSGMPDYEYLAGVYRLADTQTSDFEELAGYYENDQGEALELGFICGEFKLRFPAQSIFFQESFYLDADGDSISCYYDEMRASGRYILTLQDGGLLLTDMVLDIEPALYHRADQAN